ncbi:hypothetical protein KIW84_065822 [Lathyrus oleraceus]|uniref:Uncharacterized protein n=1 Tax=Pisum sativum TaxID=3888 RepID=A0A9D5AAB1_PEA|nr:hypothetical protein KIW84_065822 [Pisum sativum]
MDDGDDCKLAMYVIRNNCEVEIFCEPKPVPSEAIFMDKVKDKGKGKKYDEDDDKLSESSGDSSDESMRGVHFDDSEEKRMKGFDEGLDEGLDAGVDGETITEPVANNEAPSQPDKKMFITKEMVRMEFSSLKQFKDTILEHNVLNGRDVRVEKNDANKCRVASQEIPTQANQERSTHVSQTRPQQKDLTPKKGPKGSVNNGTSKTETKLKKPQREKRKVNEGPNVNVPSVIGPTIK